jgi:predicted nucleotidyltransferase
MGTAPASLASVLFGKARLAILALTYGHPDEAFHLRRIARFASTGMGVVQRELRILSDAGILERTVEGRQVYFQADRRCPIFDEIRGLITKTVGVVDIVRDALVALGDRVALAFIFGSVARGTAKRDSDVDLLVVGDLSLGDIVDALAPAQERIGREINPTVYPRREFQEKLRARHHFLTQVLAQPKLFLVGDDREVQVSRGHSSIRS